MARRLHRLLGLVLLLPILGWAATGLVFFTKPGYGEAYGSLEVRRYPLAGFDAPAPRADWIEFRQVRTVIGRHLVVRTEAGWAQRDPAGERRALPDEATIRRLVADAIAADPDRYGEIVQVAREEGAGSAMIRTTTGVEIDLDWNALTLRQSGRDTRRIDLLYRIHYLQWTGFRPVDRILGIVGLGALVALAVLGVRLALGGRSAGRA